MKIILGVTGSVAAFKAAELARRLMDGGLSVHVAMTANAEKFITPLTFEALTGNPVLRACFPEPGEETMAHITFTRGASLILVAPATANIIGKLAGGVADDTLSTALLATDLPVMMAPAMNMKMYNHPAVRVNMEILKDRGVKFIGPSSGTLACGDEGEGKLESVETITEAVFCELKLRHDLAGKKVIVTAGGSREPIDAVRYIGNRSSGRMGAAIAEAAAARGAEVTLVAGYMETDPPEGVETVRTETAERMLEAVGERFGGADALIMAAAVGDYRAAEAPEGKMKKRETWNVELIKNPDIVAEMSKRRTNQVIAGFAAETENPEQSGREKLLRKNLDMIVINDVSRSDIGFGTEDNQVIIIRRNGEKLETPKMPKSELAGIILDQVAEILAGREPGRQAEGL